MHERGPYTQTAYGKAWFPFDPRPEDVDYCTVALALSRVARFGGHTTEKSGAYSVAEHSVRASWVAREIGGSAIECLAALLHDAHEAYPPGDQLGPFIRAMRNEKHCALLGLTPVAFDGMRAVMRLAEVAVRTHFNVQAVFEDERSAALIKQADNIMLAVERRDLMGPFEPRS